MKVLFTLSCVLFLSNFSPKASVSAQSPKGDLASLALLQLNGKTFCVGSIFHERAVVTGVECTYYRYEHDNRGRAKFLIDVGGKKFGFKRSMNNYGADVQMLKEKITFNDKVKPVSLPKQNEEVPLGTECYVTGVMRATNQIISEGPFEVVDNATCLANIKGEDKLYKYVFINKAYSMCTRGQSQIFCRDDVVPGPLTCKQGDKWVLQGINAWSKASCAMNGYSVFLRASSVSDYLSIDVPDFMSKYVFG